MLSKHLEVILSVPLDLSLCSICPSSFNNLIGIFFFWRLLGRNITSLVDCSKETDGGGSGKGLYDDMLTAAERRYLRQWEKINLQRMAKMASKSHRDRIQEFNQCLANLSEHHDIPKVGPG